MESGDARWMDGFFSFEIDFAAFPDMIEMALRLQVSKYPWKPGMMIIHLVVSLLVIEKSIAIALSLYLS